MGCCGELFLVLFMVYIIRTSCVFVSVPMSPRPAQIISDATLGSKTSVFRILCSSNNTAIPFICQCFIMNPESSHNSSLTELGSLRPFLIAGASNTINRIIGGEMGLRIINTVCSFGGIKSCIISGGLGLIEFSLGSISPWWHCTLLILLHQLGTNILSGGW